MPSRERRVITLSALRPQAAPTRRWGRRTVATYTETGLSDGTAYYDVVSAVNANGESGNSTEATARPATVSPDVTVIVDPTQTKPISPWIYGINFYSGVTGAPVASHIRSRGRKPVDRLQLGNQCIQRGQRLHLQQRQLPKLQQRSSRGGAQLCRRGSGLRIGKSGYRSTSRPGIG
jgi:hypothetical protein